MPKIILSSKTQFLMEMTWYCTPTGHPTDLNLGAMSTQQQICSDFGDGNHPVIQVLQGTGQHCKRSPAWDLYFHLLLHLTCS